jgi:hypothetical protein
LRALRLRRHKKKAAPRATTAKIATTTPTIVPVLEDDLFELLLFAALDEEGFALEPEF